MIIIHLAFYEINILTRRNILLRALLTLLSRNIFIVVLKNPDLVKLTLTDTITLKVTITFLKVQLS